MKPELDKPFPAFSLPAAMPQDDGINEVVFENATFTGEPFVLFVYPRDNTEGCTIEACGFGALYPRFKELGVAIIGISRDTVRSHKNFIKKQALPYPLLSDEGGALLTEWGLINPGTMYGKPVTRVDRNTYFVDGEGVVRKTWEKVSPPGHPQEVLEYVKSLKG